MSVAVCDVLETVFAYDVLEGWDNRRALDSCDMRDVSASWLCWLTWCIDDCVVPAVFDVCDIPDIQ